MNVIELNINYNKNLNIMISYCNTNIIKIYNTKLNPVLKQYYYNILKKQYLQRVMYLKNEFDDNLLKLNDLNRYII